MRGWVCGFAALRETVGFEGNVWGVWCCGGLGVSGCGGLVMGGLRHGSGLRGWGGAVWAFVKQELESQAVCAVVRFF